MINKGFLKTTILKKQNQNTLELTLIHLQSDLTFIKLAEVHLQPPSPPEIPFSVGKPVIYRMLLKSFFLNNFCGITLKQKT